MPVLAGQAFHVTGIVQGVGFRPFVRNLAVSCELLGDVLNNSQGVFIRVFGSKSSIEQFHHRLENNPPPLARIYSISCKDIPFEERSSFEIVVSDSEGERTVAVTPDARICDDCARELHDPADRRYLYPFINCTNCGPRYSIIEDVPYDRPNTVMREFEMCPVCREEYGNPADRRYHAQPDCCGECGPQVSFVDASGATVEGDPIKQAARMLTEGKIVAIKGIGGFHLACDASNEQAVARLRERKLREEKPFAIMVPTFQQVQEVVSPPPYAEKILSSPEAPILICPKKENLPIASNVAPVNDYLGLMLPYAPLHSVLFQYSPKYLVMTSANKTDEPICIKNSESLSRLSGIADGFLLHNRKIHQRLDDSVLMSSASRPTIIRRSRGYVPSGIETGLDVSGYCSFGPMLKNTCAIGRESTIYVGQHIGDLNNPAALSMFSEVFEHLCKLFGITPHTVTCDKHPDYPTTLLARNSGMKVVEVQHHHAHLVSLMAEYRHYKMSIGFSFDGTGYGDDHQIWGGEAMVFDPRGYKRSYHLEYLPLLGGDKAAQEPWRMATAYLLHCGVNPHEHINHPMLDSLVALAHSSIPKVNTSAMGRLFDAVSSLLDLCHFSTYEAKAPMTLEGIAANTDGYYGFSVKDGCISVVEMIMGILEDKHKGIPIPVIAGRFHNTIARIILECALLLRDRHGIEDVFLTGGVMNNSYLLQTATRLLEQERFTVFTHSLLPPGDGGVSVGQLLAAACMTHGWESE